MDNRPTTKFVKIDGKWIGRVIQDGAYRSLVETTASPNSGCSHQRDWYDNDRLTPVESEKI